MYLKHEFSTRLQIVCWLVSYSAPIISDVLEFKPKELLVESCNLTLQVRSVQFCSISYVEPTVVVRFTFTLWLNWWRSERWAPTWWDIWFFTVIHGQWITYFGIRPTSTLNFGCPLTMSVSSCGCCGQRKEPFPLLLREPSPKAEPLSWATFGT